jgi:hypothetical protein
LEIRIELERLERGETGHETVVGGVEGINCMETTDEPLHGVRCGG